MITSHQISLWHELDTGTELELSARVSLTPGTRGFDPSDLEVEWIGDAAAFIDAASRDTERYYVQLAREAWHDRMRELDQDSEADEAADHQLDLYKERRELGL